MPTTNVFISSQQVSSNAGNMQLGSLVIPCPNSIGDVETFSVGSAGTITITPPTGTTTVTIIPVSTNTGTFTLKGNSGDTGVPISVTQPTLLTVTTTNNILIITSAAASIQVVFI